LKDTDKHLGSIHSQVLQDVVLRLDKAYQAFFAGQADTRGSGGAGVTTRSRTAVGFQARRLRDQAQHDWQGESEASPQVHWGNKTGHRYQGHRSVVRRYTGRGISQQSSIRRRRGRR
jgi:hypothetical protein